MDAFTNFTKKMPFSKKEPQNEEPENEEPENEEPENEEPENEEPENEEPEKEDEADTKIVKRKEIPIKKQVIITNVEEIYPWIALLPKHPAFVEPELDPEYVAGLEGSAEATGSEKDDVNRHEDCIDTRGLVPTNIDNRGRIRSACEDCDCDEFERPPKGSSCYYCGCAPTSHDLLWPPPPEENNPPDETATEETSKKSPSPDGSTKDDTKTIESGGTPTKPESSPRYSKLYQILKLKFDKKDVKTEYKEKDETTPTNADNTPKKSIWFASTFKSSKENDDTDSTQDELETARRETLERIAREMDKEIEEFEKQKIEDFTKLKEIWSEMYFKELPEERAEKDKRGILRGRCRDCDCDGYESDMPASTHCAYCGCAPTYHVAKIDYFTEKPLLVYNMKYVNTQAIKKWKKRQLGIEEETVANESFESQTEYANQGVIDAVDNEEEYVMSTIGEESETGTVLTFDARAEKKKLNEADKKKTTVVEIYPWIQEEAEPRKRVTTLAQLARDRKRKGLSARHNLILDLTEEVRRLRAEVEDVLFYDNEDTLQDVLEELWTSHHALIQEFEAFMEDLTVDSPISTPQRFPTPPITPEHIRADRRRRKFESTLMNMFKPAPLDEKAADKEFQKKVKPSKYG